MNDLQILKNASDQLNEGVNWPEKLADSAEIQSLFAEYPYIQSQFGTNLEQASILITDIQLSESTLTGAPETAKALSATVTPSASRKPISWSSTNESVATVKVSGKMPHECTVNMIDEGEASIFADSGDISTECAVKVTK